MGIFRLGGGFAAWPSLVDHNTGHNSLPKDLLASLTAACFSTILMSMPRGRLIALFFILLSLILAGLILTDAIPNLRGPAPETSEWYWPYLLRPFSRWWLPFLAATGLLAVGGWWLQREPGRDRLPLLLIMLCSLTLQLALIFADRPNVGAELVDRTLSKASNGYLATAGEIDDLDEALRKFPELMPTFDNDHARTHPPGFISAMWLTDRVLRGLPDLADTLARPATLWRCTDLWVLARPPATAASLLVWSWLPLLAATLTVLPAYYVSRSWYAPLPARLSALLVATLPALLVFAPTPDQIFACLSALSLLMLMHGLRDTRRILVLAAGLIVSVMTFLSLGNAAWAVVLAIYGLWWLFRANSLEQPSWKSWSRWGVLLIFTGGAISIWLIYWVGWGVAPWEIAQAGLEQHYELVTSLRRYDWWVVFNLVDFFIYAGPPVVAGLVWRSVEVWRGRKQNLSADGRLAIALLLVIVAINLAGSTRGEVGRLWLVFMPATAIVAGGMLGHQLNHWRYAWVILAAQIILALSIGIGWRSFYAVILPVEQPGDLVASPADILDITFGTPDDRIIELIGFDVSDPIARPGGEIRPVLFWQSDGPTLRPFTVFVQLLDSSGNLVAQLDQWPQQGRWPSTCWQGGRTVTDPYVITLPNDVQPGQYTLVTGLYDSATFERLTSTTGDNVIFLIEIVVEVAD